MTLRHLRRVAASVAATALLGVGAACGGSTEPGDPQTDGEVPPLTAASVPEADAAADWLVGQLDSGLMHNEEFGTSDHGLSIDTALALDAIGGHEDSVATITDAVAASVESYTTGVDFGTEDVYAGSTAKALVLAVSQGQDPRDFGGVDLLDRLEGLVATEEPIVGRVEDGSEGDDFANVLAQAFAAYGLVLSQSGEAEAVLDFLLTQQCEAGFFRLELTADKSADEQGCDAAAPDEPAVDTTALVAGLLQPVESEHPDLADALDRAATWIAGQQAEDGSFTGGTDAEGANANSTGLAGWALGLLGEEEAAGRAAQWVGDRQSDGDEECAADAGAIAYDDAALEAGCTDGIGDADLDQWRRTTAQAAPALLFLER